MNIAKVKKNIANLKKIREIIEISKFDTLHRLQTETKVTDTFMKIAMYSKEVVEFATEKYWAKSPLLKKQKSKKTIWIFVTISSKMLATSYSQQENLIKKEFNHDLDSLIVIGESAINFAKEFKIKPIFEKVEIDEALAEVPLIIASLSGTKEVPAVKFVSHNSFLQNEPINILPIEELNIQSNVEPINRKLEFFPSLTAAVSNLGGIYSERLTEALIRDAKYFYLKEKLIRHEGSIKSVDKKIEERTKEMNKLMRKVETEELILVTQIAKRDDHE